MAELSRFWDNTTVGDATSAPYDSSEMGEVLKALAAAENVPTYQSGVFRGVDNQLAMTIGSGLVTIASGKALVDGRYYRNTAPLNLSVGATATVRRDYVILRRDTGLQTVRLAILPGPDGTTTLPTLGTANPYEVPLYLLNIAPGGISLNADLRSYIPRHGDVSGEGGAAVHAYGQIVGAPASANSAPINVGPTKVANPGSDTGHYANDDHVHHQDSGLVKVSVSGESRAYGAAASPSTELVVAVLEAGVQYLVEFGNLVFTFAGAGVPPDLPAFANGSFGSFPADGQIHYGSGVVTGTGGSYAMSWQMTGGFNPYFVSLANGAWMRATPLV